ncbi:T9SS type A sorting domain-containing protein [Aequorivita antarctica]|uniref:T9SS type A sorting domain-containing protein n=1 Tax=Aequorivita antarctica TaxID=153266 RepID=A0A5C6Z5C6_9FLAO|nr:T9SS type A sorting domain-containing protein [Aequorivita antarctica]TXD74900.1 T9SS type A sorting domain-containing protein [Aequorivita antarctica]SRX72375.1 Internalin-J [Aequorivita antarctica]
MKKLYIVIFLLVNTFLHAQIVNIPDINFKNALIEEDVDTNNDGEIQVNEAEAVLNLNVSYKNISSLEGIQSFVNLEVLYCSGNQLTALNMSENLNLQKLTCIFNQLSNLNVTQNLNLKYLRCRENLLSNLDISQNINLETLWCSDNSLVSLDVTQNIMIVSLYCDDNLLSELDVSQNVNLESLVCSENQLNSLDLSQNINLRGLICSDNQLNSLYIDNGNNNNMGEMFSTGNLNLICIQIDDENATYPECEGFPVVGWCKDDWSSYSEDCSLGLTDLESTIINLYPNPTRNIIFLNSKNTTENLKVKIFNLEGKLLSNQNIAFKEVFIDVSNLSSGMYFLNIEDENGNTAIKKFLKE